MNDYINPYKLFTGSFIPDWLDRRPEVSSGAKRCYARLCKYAGENGFCYPKQKALRTDLGISNRQLQRYIKELIDFKLIVVNKNGRRNEYRFAVHKWMEISVSLEENELPKVELTVPQKEEESKSAALFNELKFWFLEYTHEYVNEFYIFDGAEASALKKLISKIKTILKQSNMELNNDNYLQIFKEIIAYASKDKFLSSNFELKKINSQFNSIVMGIAKSSINVNNLWSAIENL